MLRAGAVLFCLAAPALPEKIRNHFDFDAHLTAPAYFDFAVLGAPGPAEWKVVADYNPPPSPPNELTQTLDNRPADSIAAAVRRNVTFRDGSWSVALKKGQGRGGIVLRMSDEKNFLVILIDAVSGDARLYSYRNGRSRELAAGEAGWDRSWGVLNVTGAGAEISAEWNGKPLLRASDPDPVAGRTGVATAGPGLASFDEFVLDPAESKAR